MTRMRWRGMLLGLFGLSVAGCPCTPIESPSGGTPTGSSGPRTKMTHNQGPQNGLARQALEEGNAQMLANLPGIPLNKVGSPDGDLIKERLTKDPYAQALMKYVVSCALQEGVEVDARLPSDPDNPYAGPWRGELGLCPEWASGRATGNCQEIVSACVLARVNAREDRVVISVRGEPAAKFPMQGRVDVETMFREKRGTPIRSLASCPGGETEDCGFSTRYIGICGAKDSKDRKNRTVKLTPTRPHDEPALGTSAVIRVCKGLYGCNRADKEEEVREYAGFLEQGEAGQGVSFQCPTNGPLKEDVQYGYYSVLVKDDPEVDVSATVIKGASGRYPAWETEIFTYREGAFYGNIFQQVTPANKPAQYACYSDIWTMRGAELTDRFCAKRRCFENETLACGKDPFVIAPEPASGPACRGQKSPAAQPFVAPPLEAQPFYEGCRGGDPTFNPITVYLNEPCDLARDLGSCTVDTNASALPEIPISEE